MNPLAVAAVITVAVLMAIVSLAVFLMLIDLIMTDVFGPIRVVAKWKNRSDHQVVPFEKAR